MIDRNQALQKFARESYMPKKYGYDSLRGYKSLGSPEVLPPNERDLDFISPVVDFISDKVALADDGSARAITDQISQSIAKESSKNSGYILLVALAGGVLGGTVLRGTVSTMVAAGVLGWAGYKLLESSATTTVKTPK